MGKRTRYTLLTVLLVLGALAVAVYLRQKAPPEVARLLPESDAIVYVNLKPLRAATHFDRNPVKPSAEYQQFIDATGIVVERDLDSAALALHRMQNPKGPNGAVAYSEVLQGRFDRERLAKYLASVANSQEDYAGRTIYSIPSDGRTLRVTMLGYDMVAGSNMPTPEQIHSILDRQRAAASPFSGSSLLSARYAEVPAFSGAWAIGHVGLPFSEDGKIRVGGLELPMGADTTFVASLGFLPALRHGTGGIAVRIEEITTGEGAAETSVRSLNGLLALFRSLQLAQQPVPRTTADAALREFMDSIVIEQKKTRAVLTATLPQDMLRQLGR